MATATVAGTVGVKSAGLPFVKCTSAFRGAGVKAVACRGNQASPLIGLRVVATATKTTSEQLTPTTCKSLNGLVADSKTIRPVIVVDNYDSFTYNLCQYLGDLKCVFEVYRNDELTVDELARKNPRGILISPGPGTPQDSGISLETVLKLGPTIPLFGVCMGLQCMGEAFGGNVVRAPNGVMHGKTSLVYHNDEEEGLMSGLPNPFVACRYHSLVIDRATFPSKELEITAWTEDGIVMGVRHKKHRHIEGVQFHPESIITENGMKIVENFIRGLDRFAALKGEVQIHIGA